MTLRPGIPTVGEAEAPQARVARALFANRTSDDGGRNGTDMGHMGHAPRATPPLAFVPTVAPVGLKAQLIPAQGNALGHRATTPLVLRGLKARTHGHRTHAP
jgi:hypothetical protein